MFNIDPFTAISYYPLMFNIWIFPPDDQKNGQNMLWTLHTGKYINELFVFDSLYELLWTHNRKHQFKIKTLTEI
jgi:hypothetical protein